MSIRLMSRVWGESPQKGPQLLVLLALADFANDEGESWPKLSTLAQKARISISRVARVLNHLEKIGEIRRERSNGGRHKSTRYFIRKTMAESPQYEKENYGGIASQTMAESPHRLIRHGTVNNKKSIENFLNPILPLPTGVDPDLWEKFKASRILLKARMTPYAEELVLKRLAKFQAEGEDPNEIMEHSIACGYKGVFSLKREGLKSRDEQPLPEYLRKKL